MRGLISAFLGDRSGAVSPMYALALLALIAIAGIGFDYGRLAAMHTELQNAADQAALAAATQLDGRADAIDRAQDAATETFASTASQFVNETRISTDPEGRPITRLNFTFYDGYAGDEPGAATTQGEDAAVVQVDVDGRGVIYALTPVVDAFFGNVGATAMAGLRKAACRVPPIMVCIDHVDFSLPALAGKGLRMRWKNSSDVTPLAPGNYGFLLGDKVDESNVELGMNLPDKCVNLDEVKTEPGFRNKESDALNTRFDMAMEPVGAKRGCDTASGNFCPAEGVRKDYAIPFQHAIVSPNPTLGLAEVRAGFTCPTTFSKARQWIAFKDIPASAVIERREGDSFRLDDCFYHPGGTCDYLGDGVWNIDGYLALHHPGKPASDFNPQTRYSVYKWERDGGAALLPSQVIGFLPDGKPKAVFGGWRHDITAWCSYAQPVFGPTVGHAAPQKDRRVLTVAAAKCTGLAGRKNVTILGWMDVFVLTPAESTDPLATIQAEIIGDALRADDLTGFQYFGHDRAVRIR